jgi:hypothetical protein
MIRLAAILLAGAVTGAAGSSLPLPLPPVPPKHIPAEEAAPVPDRGLRAPDRDTRTAEFRLRIFSLDEHDSGLAFIPGSAYAAPEDRKLMQTPGFTVSLPLQ